MENIIIIICCLIVLAILHYLFQTSTYNIKDLYNNEKLNKLVEKFPKNVEICKKILLIMGNKKTKIIQSENGNKNFYFIFKDTVSISNKIDNYSRIQKITKECIKLMQDKKILWFDLVISIIYYIYFILIIILTLLGLIHNTMLHIFLLLLIGFVQFVIRSYLETNAIIKSRYLARNYMRIERVINPEEVEEIVGNYDILNKIEIQNINYKIILRITIKIVIYSLLVYSMHIA